MKSNRADKAKFYLIYTILFLCLSYTVFYWFLRDNVSLINTADGIKQHYRAFCYFGKWLRGVFYRIFVEHSLDIQTFTFGMGYGTDSYSALQYYAFGDLLNIVSAFVPFEYSHIAFQALMVFRAYLAGITFFALCFYLRPNVSKIGILAGMFTYSFCSFYMFLAMWHAFFMNPMIYFPLVILGAEKLIRENKLGFFAFSVFLAGGNNFYFFYMIVIFLILYAVLRTAFTYRRKWAKWGELALKFLAGGVLGTMMAMLTLLPVILAFPSNPRVYTGIQFSLFYEKEYYIQLLRNLFTFVYYADYDTQLGYSVVALLGIFVLVTIFVASLFRGNMSSYSEKSFLSLLLILTVILISIPAVGYAMTGFSYVVNRWAFVIALLVSYILVSCWDDMFSLKLPEIIAVIALALLFTLLCAVTGVTDYANARWELVIFGVIIGIAAVAGICFYILRSNNNRKTDEFAASLTDSATSFRLRRNIITALQILVLLCTMLSISVNAYFAYSTEQDGMLNEFVEDATKENMQILMQSTEVQAVEEAVMQEGLDINSFYRYAGRDLVWNAALIDGISSTQYYWSLSSEVVSKFFRDFGNNDMQNFSYVGLDDRAIMNTLSGVKYYSLRFNTDEENRYVPYGFSHIYDKYNFAVFRNDYDLSLGYAYYSVIPQETFEALEPIGRQEAILSGAVLGQDDNTLPEAEPEFTSVSIPYTITTEGDITVSDGKWEAKEGAVLHISFDGLENCETYLWLNNIHVKSDNTFPIIEVGAFREGNLLTEKKIYYRTEKNQFYSAWHNLLVNMGYADEAKDEITLTFTADGTYTFDDLKIYCQPLDNYVEKVSELRDNRLVNVELNKNPISHATSQITGSIDMKDDGILCVTIPYTNGWTAYVDGQKQNIIKTNTMFMGLRLSSGGHSIEFRYHTPGLFAGLILTVTGFIIFVILIRREGKRNA